MNRRNDYMDILRLANEDLEKHGSRIEITDDGDGAFNVEITGGGWSETFAEGYYEDELAVLVNDAWAHERARIAAESEKRIDGLVEAYLGLTDEEKDEFLRRTGNE